MNPTTLPCIEIGTYIILWVSAVMYALYELFVACQQYYKFYDCDDIFEDGWPALRRKVDHTDYEWRLSTSLIFHLLPWLCLHLMGAEIFRRHSVRITLIWYTSVTVLCITYLLSFQSVFLMFVQIFLYYVLLRLKSMCIIWISFFISTVYQNSIITWFLPDIHEDQLHIVFVILSWLHLRCISFTSSVISSKAPPDLALILGYCFYLPYFTLGPIILYEEFIYNIHKAQITFWFRFQNASLKFIRYTFWYYFTEFGLHFIYIGVLPHQYNVFYLNPWAMCGFGFAMGIFFFLKYLVVYGIAGSVVHFEGHDPPPPPRCIACIHLYSHMWRHFDTGLHKFIKNCIYRPLAESLKNFVPKLYLSLLISFICFSFIFIWHGLHNYVLIWSSLNFFGLVIELLCKKISSHQTYCYHLSKIFDKQNQRRLNALLAAPLTIMSAISNFYFFGEGMEVGTAFVIFLSKSSMSVKLAIIFFMYTLSQISIEYSMTHKDKTH